jgi:hypothetical protein
MPASGESDRSEQSAGEHNALSDARHNRLVAYFLDSLGGR